MAVEAEVDLYDSDILKIEQVIKVLNRRVWTRQDHGAFIREAKDRFHAIGLEVDVLMLPMDDQHGWDPKITIMRRVEQRHEFDPEKMAWEVQRDVLGIDEPGTVSMGKNGLIVVKDPKKVF